MGPAEHLGHLGKGSAISVLPMEEEFDLWSWPSWVQVVGVGVGVPVSNITN